MSNNMKIYPGIKRPMPIEHNKARSRSTTDKQAPKSDFSSVLQQKLKTEKLHFSKHAMQRLEKRGIHLSKADLDTIGEAISKADSKGAKESLVLFNDNAFIVSVKSKTVITAVHSKNARDNVFTNIDSAIICK